MSKSKSKIRLIFFISVILISLFSITSFLTILFGKVDANGESIIGSLVTAISIIVALGIGYSMINVYDYSNKVEALANKVEKLNSKLIQHREAIEQKVKNNVDELNESVRRERDVTDEKISDLQFNNLLVKYKTELIKRSQAAESMFRDGKLLHALKTEYDILCFIFDNQVYFESEFDSNTGKKRSLISNDLLEIERIVDEDHLNKLSVEDFKDIVKVLLCDIHYLKYSSSFVIMSVYEQARFKRIFDVTEELIFQIMERKFPLKINTDTKNRLIFYSKFIKKGNQPDDKQSD